MTADHAPEAPCGKHHPTDQPGAYGGYPRCCCGDTWMAYSRHCVAGGAEGDPVLVDEQERLRHEAANAPYLRIQLDGYAEENKKLKEELRKANDALVKEIWEKAGFEALIHWKGRAERAEAALADLQGEAEVPRERA